MWAIVTLNYSSTVLDFTNNSSEASSSTLQKTWISCKKAGFQQKSWISAAHGQKTWISVGAHCVHPEIQVFCHLVLQKTWISCKK